MVVILSQIFIMKDITNREDIELMVNTFYDVVRKDKRLSFLFDETAKVDWPHHLPKMYDFWESVLFDKALFSGNPMGAHIKLHNTETLKSEDFDIWIRLFNANIDKHFSGPITEKAKQRAESIATITKIKTVYS